MNCECNELCCTVGRLGVRLESIPASHRPNECQNEATVQLLLNFNLVNICRDCDRRITGREIRRHIGR